MAAKIPMLALSPTMESGTIVKWVVSEGEPYKAGDVLCEVETDKATMDYEATSAGTLLKILVTAGKKVQVGDAIALSGNAGENIDALIAETSSAGVSPEAENKVAGDAVGGNSIHGTKRDFAKDSTPGSTATDHLPGGVRASPLARALAREKGIDIAKVEGSGPGGRVVKEDVERSMLTATAASPVRQPVVIEEDTVIAVSGKRQVIAARLSESKTASPHFYLTVKVVMEALIAARAGINAQSEARLSFNAFLIRLVAEALKRHPEINSSWNGDTIIRHGRVDIALAVAQPEGLITPVVRNAAHKGIGEIDRELRDLVARAREGKLTPQEYTDSTFTISNLGSFGVQQFTAIINPPNSAILAVGEIFREPFEEKNGSIGFRSVMNCTLSCDHRVIDGAIAAGFARDMRYLLEDPVSALV